MAETITKPIILDETAKQIKETLSSTGTALKESNDATNALLTKIFDAINGTTETQALVAKMKATVDNYTTECAGVRLRFKNLGSSLTAAQADAISKGDFSDLLVGDYWLIGGIHYRIVDNTGWGRRRGDTEYNKPYLVIMPDEALLAADGSTTHFWNATDTTAGGYNGAAYRNTYRAQCRTKIASAFGAAHIGTHRELLSNAVTDGKASGWSWYDCDVELPSEAMIYGASVWSNSTIAGHGYNVGTAYGQLALFRLAPQYIVTRYNYWLRDVVASTCAAAVDNGGFAAYSGASNAWVGVRPYFYLI